MAGLGSAGILRLDEMLGVVAVLVLAVMVELGRLLGEAVLVELVGVFALAEAIRPIPCGALDCAAYRICVGREDAFVALAGPSVDSAKGHANKRKTV